MGLLDDAIRDHLDLKRRRGADPAEVERAEREALGPVRRGPEEPAPAFDAEAPAAGIEEHESDWDDQEHGPVAHDDGEYEPFDDDDEYDDDEYDDEPPESAVELTPPRAAGPASSPEPLRFSDEAADPVPSPRDPYEPSTAEFFEAAPSAQEHLKATPPVPPDSPSAPPPLQLEHPEADATAEFDVERALSDEHQEPDEDVLEETPEFLSDTPDHDRLWFEQKPPRDFDFDG